MRALSKLLFTASVLLAASPVLALPGAYVAGAKAEKTLVAAAAKKPKKGAKGVREKHITGEVTVKGKDSTNVDFDAADIGGQRKTPMGTLINQNKADKNYDFVKIRLRWHPEMVQSASSLDSGTGN